MKKHSLDILTYTLQYHQDTSAQGSNWTLLILKGLLYATAV